MLSIHQNNLISRLPICGVWMLGAGLLSLRFAVLPAWGATVTVPAGSDLRAALSQLRSGDTLLLEPGTYADGFGESIPSGVTLRAVQPRTAVIRSPGNGPVIRLTGDQHDIVLDGLVLDKENQGSGWGLYVMGNARTITVQNGEIRNILGNGTCSPSMFIGADHDYPGLTIRNNFLHDVGDNDPPANPQTCNFSYGIYLAFRDSVIEGNVFANVSAFGIHGYPNPQGNIVRNNTFCNTGPLLMRGSGNVVEDNRLYRVGQTVYPWERGKTLMVDGGNTERNNQVFAEVDGSICKGGMLTPIRQPLPAPWNLRAVLR